jgi:hypothetical protein
LPSRACANWYDAVDGKRGVERRAFTHALYPGQLLDGWRVAFPGFYRDAAKVVLGRLALLLARTAEMTVSLIGS